eukprot:TRINITY_DN13608_c0_g1_i1.p1 TRINITY_DN13608_c0_g1~~TRINITY_DN13608_c0_g1_i1.p1  ORF type:complete len:233 (-),score=24.31 TRINITY_DN13608_c0_g1_i1:37-735(-)
MCIRDSSRIVFFLINLHITPRRVILTRHGESESLVKGCVGGDSDLTPFGNEYAHKLAEWVLDNLEVDTGEVTVWTSTLKRAIQTTQYIPTRKIRLKNLDELDAGKFEGMTYAEISQQYPEEYNARAHDKLNYRYPGGESYLDLIQRLEPIIFELERQQKDVVVVAHQGVLRCLYAYLKDVSLEEVPYIPIPLHAVIKLTPRAYACTEEIIRLMPETSESVSPSIISEKKSYD